MRSAGFTGVILVCVILLRATAVVVKCRIVGVYTIDTSSS